MGIFNVEGKTIFDPKTSNAEIEHKLNRILSSSQSTLNSPVPTGRTPLLVVEDAEAKRAEIRDSPSSQHAGDESNESDEGHEGDEEGHEAQGNEGCRGGGTHESNESDESHEGDEKGHEAQGNQGCRGGGTHESYESYEGYEESNESDESYEGHEGYEEVKCGGEKCDLSSLLVGDGHERCSVAWSCGGVPRPAPLYNHW